MLILLMHLMQFYVYIWFFWYTLINLTMSSVFHVFHFTMYLCDLCDYLIYFFYLIIWFIWLFDLFDMIVTLCFLWLMCVHVLKCWMSWCTQKIPKKKPGWSFSPARFHPYSTATMPDETRERLTRRRVGYFEAAVLNDEAEFGPAVNARRTWPHGQSWPVLESWDSHLIMCKGWPASHFFGQSLCTHQMINAIMQGQYMMYMTVFFWHFDHFVFFAFVDFVASFLIFLSFF